MQFDQQLGLQWTNAAWSQWQNPAGLIARAPGAPVFLDTPGANPAALALAERHGMAPVFETARMYRNGAPEMRLDRCFGVTTFELG